MPQLLCRCMNSECANQHFADFPRDCCFNPACSENHLWENQGEAYACYGNAEEEVE